MGQVLCLAQPLSSSACGNSRSVLPNLVVAQEKSFVWNSLLILICWHPIQKYFRHCRGHMKQREWSLGRRLLFRGLWTKAWACAETVLPSRIHMSRYQSVAPQRDWCYVLSPSPGCSQNNFNQEEHERKRTKVEVHAGDSRPTRRHSGNAAARLKGRFQQAILSIFRVQRTPLGHAQCRVTYVPFRQTDWVRAAAISKLKLHGIWLSGHWTWQWKWKEVVAFEKWSHLVLILNWIWNRSVREDLGF